MERTKGTKTHVTPKEEFTAPKKTMSCKGTLMTIVLFGEFFYLGGVMTAFFHADDSAETGRISPARSDRRGARIGPDDGC